MRVSKNEIFTLWICNKPSELNYRCWKSWIDLGYRPKIYYDELSNFAEMPPRLKSKSQLISLSTLPSFLNIDTQNLLQKTDIWRFMMLKHYGGTWIDSDMFLIARLPFDDILISSERTLQAGGRKSKEMFRPNIGVLRFPPHHKFINAVVDKILPTTKEDIEDNINSTSKMMKFIKLIKTKKWSQMLSYVNPPEHFCPIDYVFAKEIYTHDQFEPLKEKYGLELNTDFSESYAIHLWENLALNKFKIDFENQKNINKNSIYQSLLNIC